MATATSIDLDERLEVRLRRLAETRQRSAHSVMQEAIAQYVEREEKREVLQSDAVRAWEGFRETGLHLDSAEADRWLERLEAGEDIEPPTCHR